MDVSHLIAEFLSHNPGGGGSGEGVPPWAAASVYLRRVGGPLEEKSEVPKAPAPALTPRGGGDVSEGWDGGMRVGKWCG